MQNLLNLQINISYLLNTILKHREFKYRYIGQNDLVTRF